MKRQLTTIMILAAFVAACVPALPDKAYPENGTYQVATDLTFKLSQRDFLLHVPPGIAPNKPLPLVVVLHGAFSTAGQTEQETGFSKLADRENFLVAYPEGIGLFGLLQHWNAGHCCGKAAKDQIDDVAFIAEVIATIKQKVSVDPHRIYLAGMSNGGMLTYRYAAERPGELAAIAVVSGTIGSHNIGKKPAWEIPAPTQPIPVIIFHGTADGHIPVKGGISPLKGGNRSYLPVTDAIEFWRQAGQCDTSTLIAEQRQGSIRSHLWKNCVNNYRIEYHELENWGHRWPAPFFTGRLENDERLLDFNATEKIWDFLQEFSLDKPIGETE